MRVCVGLLQIYAVRGDTEAALKHNEEAMALEARWGVRQPDTQVLTGWVRASLYSLSLSLGSASPTRR